MTLSRCESVFSNVCCRDTSIQERCFFWISPTPATQNSVKCVICGGVCWLAFILRGKRRNVCQRSPTASCFHSIKGPVLSPENTTTAFVHPEFVFLFHSWEMWHILDVTLLVSAVHRRCTCQYAITPDKESTSQVFREVWEQRSHVEVFFLYIYKKVCTKWFGFLVMRNWF